MPRTDDDRRRALALALQPGEDAGTMIGPYKLLQKIGEGGFGVVWMAEQETPVRRRVALKIIKSGMDTCEVIARFEAERQALAMMEHPHIARVFDAGETDAGRPYFVMELVRGVPITKFCDDNLVPTEARLRLFIAVCQAVQHAHQKGIIHRDLKPSNIIVTLHDGVPMPKIIDFGIAKATEARLTNKTLFTQFHAFLGTPAYTSPEQMELSGLDVDTRSDIYSLGILLYELLTGRPPFDPETLLKSGLDEMRRTIREVDPPRPSQRVGTLSVELRTTVARQRSTDADRLSLLLRGDLDWIVMHCLEKDRTRRYATANDLLADVGRFIDHEPIVARPPSAAYRFSKFVRRHRLGFATGVAVTLALLASLVIASVSLARESAARRAADANAARARATAQFMREMLEGVGPSVALGQDTTLLRGIADRTARRLATELRDQPEVAAELRETLGVVYRDLGEYATAEPLLREAAAIYAEHFGIDSAERAAALDHLGTVLHHLDHPADAEAALQKALEIRERLGAERPEVADTLLHLSEVRSRQGKPDEAEVLARRALLIRQQNLTGEDPAITEAYVRLGTVAREKVDHVRAAELHAQAVAILHKLPDSNNPSLATALDQLGFSLGHIGRRADALAAYRESFEIRRRVLGDGHPRTTAALLPFIGLTSTDSVDEATVQLVRDFVANQRRLLPPGAVSLGPTLLAFASLLDRPGRSPEEARAARDEGLALLEASRRHGPALDSEIIGAMRLFAWWKFTQQEPADGRVMAEETLKLVQTASGTDGKNGLLPNHVLAWLYLGMRRYDDAARQFAEAVRAYGAVRGPANAFTVMDAGGLGAAHRGAGRLAESRRVLEEVANAWPTGSTLASPPPGTLAIVLGELGATMNRTQQFADAERVLREALGYYQSRPMGYVGLQIRPRAWVASELGRALAGQGKIAEAERFALDAFAELTANRKLIYGDADGMLRVAAESVAMVYAAAGKTEEAALWRQRMTEFPPGGE